MCEKVGKVWKKCKQSKKVKKKWKSEKSQKVKKNWGQNKKSILAVFDRFGRFRGGRREEVTMPLNCGTYNLNCTPDFYADYISFHARPVLKIVRSSKQKLACDTPWYWKKNITGHSSPIWNLFNLFSSQTLWMHEICVWQQILEPLEKGCSRTRKKLENGLWQQHNSESTEI